VELGESTIRKEHVEIIEVGQQSMETMFFQKEYICTEQDFQT
jgi:hypothetical protein